MVDRLSGGKAGYILSDFDELGSEGFIRQFYPQTDKQSLVILRLAETEIPRLAPQGVADST